VNVVGKSRKHLRLLAGLIMGLVAVLLFIGISISFGIVDISMLTVVEAFLEFDGSREHLIISTTRLPRALIAAAVGACLAVAGAMTQALTRNPLAAPDLLGINHGAALLVVLSLFLVGGHNLTLYAWAAFLGAGAVSILVFLLGSAGRGGMTPLKLTLAGVSVTTLLSASTQSILIFHERSLDEMRFWLAGSVVGRDLALLVQVLPFMTAGLLLAFFLSREVDTLQLGDDVAKSLGQPTKMVRTLAFISVVLLSGSSVAVAGPIGFVGLAVPHLVRSIVGKDHRWIFSYSAVAGAALLLLADVAARFILDNQELPVGVMTAIIGAPFFIYLARRRVHKL
jgi:iron complex transport system permease protein